LRVRLGAAALAGALLADLVGRADRAAGPEFGLEAGVGRRSTSAVGAATGETGATAGATGGVARGLLGVRVAE